jgi:hypothetical protein
VYNLIIKIWGRSGGGTPWNSSDSGTIHIHQHLISA